MMFGKKYIKKNSNNSESTGRSLCTSADQDPNICTSI